MKKRGFITPWLAFPLLAGVFLRIWQLPRQIVLHDEWHGVAAAVNHSFGYIATHFQRADNCIPLSLFYKALLETAGLAESGLRLPPLLFGILIVILLPLSVQPLTQNRDRLVFAFFLALSPLLIYFSRFARPYGITAGLSFLAVVFFFRWQTGEEKKYLILYLLTGIFAVWFNLTSFPVVTAPLAFFFFYSFKNRPALPAIKKIIIAGLLFAAGFGLWFLPAVSSLKAVTSKVQSGFINWTTLEMGLQLFAGSGKTLFVMIFFILFITGMVEFAARQPVFFGLMLTVFLLHFLSIVIIRPYLIEVPIVFTRYSIGVMPFWLLAGAAGLGKAGRELKKISVPKPVLNGGLALFLSVYFLTGPVPPVLFKVNNFTNHPHFNWDPQLPVLKAAALIEKYSPSFYAGLKQDQSAAVIIETPYPANSWYHLYQLQHRKRVKIGHPPQSLVSRASGIMDESLQFTNFVNIYDSQAVKKSAASYIIVHKDVYKERKNLQEKLPPLITAESSRPAAAENQAALQASRRRLYWEPARKQASAAAKFLADQYGPPVFEDTFIQVFKIEK